MTTAAAYIEHAIVDARRLLAAHDRREAMAELGYRSPGRPRSRERAVSGVVGNLRLALTLARVSGELGLAVRVREALASLGRDGRGHHTLHVERRENDAADPSAMPREAAVRDGAGASL